MEIKEDRHCFSCGKSFRTASEYERHKKRKTPCLIQEVPDDQLKNPNRCKYCNRILATQRTLNKHYDRCKIKNGGTGILFAKLEREQELKYLKRELEYKEQINGLLKEKVSLLGNIAKLQNGGVTHSDAGNAINGNHNTNTNNSHNIANTTTINVTNYNAPNVEGIKLTRDSVRYKRLIDAIIEMIYFNPDHPENHNILLKNAKDNIIAVYDHYWKLLASKEDHENLRIDLCDIVRTEGKDMINGPNGFYEGDKDKFNKLDPSFQRKIGSFNSGDPDECVITFERMISLLNKHKLMIEKSIREHNPM